MRKILTVIGTRPEAIKLAPIIMEFKYHTDEVISRVCVTAQHRQMLDQVLMFFEIEADYDLNIMTPGQSLAQATSRVIGGLNQVITEEQPDVVLVQGDTTTAFCGALVSYYHQTKVGHVEAGLRTENKYAPFPEEINRRLVAQVADFHFAPTDRAKSALIKENIAESAIFVTGNTVIDALLWTYQRVHKICPDLPVKLVEALDGCLVILVTGHRRESFGEGFKNICHAIREVADAFLDVVFVYPVHLNPNVQEPVNHILGGHRRIHLIEPLSYAPFVWLMDRASIVLTDSGGIQEEAPSLGKPVLVMRKTTERPEGIEAGNAKLVGVQKESIIEGLTQLLQHPELREQMGQITNPYGDGKSSSKIVNILIQNFS